MRRYQLLILFIMTILVGVTRADDKSAVKAAKLGNTRNVHVCDGLFLAGQPSQQDLKVIKGRGIKRIVSLRRKGEVTWDEPKAARRAGLSFVRVPFGPVDSLTDDVFLRVRRLLQESKEMPTLLHCGSANRVGAVWLAYRVLDQGVPLGKAVKEAREIGLRSVAYERVAREYIARGGREKSVRPGINKRFLSSRLKVAEWVARFEGESREVYRSRKAILAALKIKPGMRVADVGAGTGFFSALFSRQVGPTGWVYAVDISPVFIQHISTMVSRAGLKTITPVLCAEDSVRLAPSSVDLVFVCDTYHHFEYPQSTLASIYKALRPKGVLAVIDFHRIPGKSRKFILGHVRAGKQVFRKEIETAGFKLLEDVQLKGLKENYFLRFQKP